MYHAESLKKMSFTLKIGKLSLFDEGESDESHTDY